MASQSPTRKNDPGLNPRDARTAYIAGWSAIRELLAAGASWSGSERHCVFLNLGTERFGDLSWVSGCDFSDDGRFVIPADFDGDGDLDLLFRHRNGPQLRLMRNDLAPKNSALLLRLRGKGGNRDAIGARVTLRQGTRRIVRHLALEGSYLGQPGRWLHFGTREIERVDELSVRWPDGSVERIEGVERAGRFVVAQGSGRAVAAATKPLALQSEGRPTAGDDAGLGSRILLRVPLPLPPTLLEQLCGDASPKTPVLVNLWSQSCPPCGEELSSWAEKAELLRGTPFRLVALGMDPPAEREAAGKRLREWTAAAPELFLGKFADERLRRAIELLVLHVRGVEEPLVAPMSLLIDERGRLQLLALGKLSAEQLVDDLRNWTGGRTPDHLRGLAGGRWFVRARRDLPRLSRAFREEGLHAEARFYQLQSKRRGPR